jgi:hypothetical protein
MVRSLRLVVSDNVTSTAHRRRAPPCLRHGVLSAVMVFGPLCNMAFFEGPLCKVVT